MSHAIHPALMLSGNNTFRMTRSSATSPWLRRLVLFTALGGALAAEPLLFGDAKQTPPQFFGTYTVHFRGYYSGEGTAVVQPNSVIVTVTALHDAGGRNYSIPSGYLTLVGDHFSGTISMSSSGGSAGSGPSATVQGHVESADNGTNSKDSSPNPNTGQVVFNGHISATFQDGFHHGGRFAGPMIPPAAPATPAN